MKVWTGAVHAPTTAATRLRLGPLCAHLEMENFDVSRWTFLDTASTNAWGVGGRKRLLPALHGFESIRKAMVNISNIDLAVIQRECLPFNNLFLERFLASKSPYIWDIDDSLWTNDASVARLIRGGPKKYETLLTNAAEVWAGNRLIADWCTAMSDTPVFLVPTTSPIPIVPGLPVLPRRLAWVGTPSTGPFIEKLLTELQFDLGNWVIDVVGADIRVPPKVNAVLHPWSQEIETRVLSRAWAGLYPIDVSHPLALGKSALKAVLFGGYGLPTIATRTPSNADVIVDGQTGRLVDDATGWKNALEEISVDSIRDEWGSSARQRMLDSYNPEKWAEFQVQRVMRYGK